MLARVQTGWAGSRPVNGASDGFCNPVSFPNSPRWISQKAHSFRPRNPQSVSGPGGRGLHEAKQDHNTTTVSPWVLLPPSCLQTCPAGPGLVMEPAPNGSQTQKASVMSLWGSGSAEDLISAHLGLWAGLWESTCSLQTLIDKINNEINHTCTGIKRHVAKTKIQRA